MKKDVELEKEFDPFEDYSNKKSKKLTIEEEKKPSKKPNRKKKKINLIPQDNLDLILCLVFVILLVITIVLGFKVNTAKKNHREYVKSSIVIPVLGPDTNNQISVDVSNMKKGETKDYSFKISNNKDNNVNTEDVLYALQLEKADSIAVEVYKNESEENILQANNLIIDNKLIGNEEQTDVYVLKIKANKKTGKQELITIRVIS